MTIPRKQRVFGNATGKDRSGMSSMLQICHDLGVSAFMGISLKGTELHIPHNGIMPHLGLGDALSTLGVASGKRVILRPNYESSDERAFDCATLVATTLATKNIGLVLLTQDRDLLSLIRSNGLNIETCLFIPDLSEARDPLGTLVRLGCKHLATNYNDPTEHAAYEGIAEKLFGEAGIETWLFTSRLDPANSVIPAADWINVISELPGRILRNRAGRGK